MANHEARRAASERAKFSPDWEKLNAYFSCTPTCREWKCCPRCKSKARAWFDKASARIAVVHDREDADLKRKIATREAV